MLPAYLVRMFRRGGYRTQFGNRFGRMPPLPPRGERRRAWVHAVSVGETLAIAPVVHELYRRGVEVFFTTTTTTAFAVARDRLAAETIGIGYFPLDFLPFTRAAWRRVQPDLVVLTEGEFWPEFLRCAGKKGTPVVSVNARLSDRSFGRLRRVPWLARWWAGGVDR
ncbi:MAG: 3-deoxy-D-manno-octulosonic acid transferase, partial [Verrucomicrobia bacterium]